MNVIQKIEPLRTRLKSQKLAGETLALVPTMGALHEGHLALVRRARDVADRVVVSIFVNPLQFGPQEDFARYPRDLAHDVQLLADLGVDTVFAPTVEDMYPLGNSWTRVEVTTMSTVLCGRTRPTHFAGVTTVVSKLFNLVQPDFAVFGEKDWQQLSIIRRMVADLNFPVTIIGVPTVREADGLAKSSRNQYLSPEDRLRAPALYRGLQQAQSLYQAGERQVEALIQAARGIMEEAGIDPEYLEIVDPVTLEPMPTPLDRPARMATAARVGGARLIDNIGLG
ncbi:pantothenate synthetase [Sulfobacillus acidophilus DSM 10332]|uniref:Pantothenate synthetase n=1 Tax=Sulfobacillus acidophilus (strain ATCC 700253 / DSM 10332 / NAL) TaxID=679936 RepID=G8TZM0_SULAD|nr:pantothenate synthetase [Sulfobacillus acidophilus DSM 10332]